jgi:AcrR family transcriptional regulator
VSSEASIRSDDRRAQILEATVRVISARGADDARLVDVAEAAGVSVGAIQHHFGSRATLLAAAFRALNDRTHADYQAIARGDTPPLERLVALLRLGVCGADGDELDHEWAVWLEYWSTANRDPRLRAEAADIYEKWREPFREAIVQGIACGKLHPQSPVEDILDRLVAQIDGLALRAMLEPERLPIERVLELLVASLSLELDPEPGGSA